MIRAHMSQKTRRRHAFHSQIRRLNKRIERLNGLSNRYSRYRLVIILAGLAIGISCSYLVSEWLGGTIIGVTLAVFNVVAYFHRRIERSITRHQIWLQIKTTQMARMDLNWPQIPAPSGPAPRPKHPFEIDLDITGQKSLHQLIDLTVSQDGSELLRQWLLQTYPEPETIKWRQALVKELAPLARFRDKLLMAYNLVSKEELEGKKLLHFLERRRTPGSFRWVLLLSVALAATNLLLFALNKLALIPPFWIASVTIYGVIYFMNQGYVAPLLDDSDFISEELKKFKVISRYLESYNYDRNPHLRKLCQPFWQTGNRPSQQLKRITVVGTAIGLRMNPLLRLILNAAVPWDFTCTHFLNKNKRILAARLPQWLEVLFELEALVSLANFAYLNPHYVFPHINLEKGPKDQFVFDAKAIGHPLLPDGQKKCNDFSFNSKGEIGLITGSNMSGKSTFLKTIGINLCLAFAGGPVNAEYLETSLYRLSTCIQINDSITDGFSFFYAEVKRLKALLDDLENENPVPLLFLIDEIFKGTNNRERYLGSRAYIQALVGKNGLGAVSTHDLELTKLADNIPSLTNYHFKEHVEKGKMVFDYKLRPGPCPTTNALKIMRMEGLPVEE